MLALFGTFEQKASSSRGNPARHETNDSSMSLYKPAIVALSGTTGVRVSSIIVTVSAHLSCCM
jgi:hypothetical protein